MCLNVFLPRKGVKGGIKTYEANRENGPKHPVVAICMTELAQHSKKKERVTTQHQCTG